jgi:photosystem II stability/assembly factor-like uncharacterized protein
MKTSRLMMRGLVLLVLTTLNARLSIAYAQSVVSTNWNDLVTNWVQSSVPNEHWSSIASSSDGNKLAAVANYGGIWTSTNAGVSWTQTSAPNTNWNSIASSSDGTKLAAVANYGNYGGIWTSTNAGANWSQSSASTNTGWYSIASSSDGTKLAAVVGGGLPLLFPGGIYTSTNAGLSWSQTSAPTNYWSSIASSSDGVKLAVVVSRGGIWTSTNAGAAWIKTGAPNEGWQSIVSSSDGTKLAAVVFYGGIYTSTDAGATWTLTSAPNPEWSSIASASDGTELAAVANYGGIWTAHATIQTNAGLTNIIITPANFVIAPGSNVTFTATGQFTNGFANLTSANGLVWNSSDPTVATIDTNGVAKGLRAGSTTISATWSNVTGDTVFTVLPPPAISTNPVSATVSPGGTVTLNVSASGSDLSYQWAFDGTNIVGATNATLIITNVSGANVGSYTVTVNSGVGSVTSQAASVASMNIGLFQSVTNWNTLANWTQTSAPTNIDWDSIASSSDGTRLAAVVDGGGIYTSTNAGETWTETSAPNTNWNSIASSSDGSQLAAVVDGGGICTSTNAGVTWTQTSAPVGSWVSIASSSNGTKLAAGIPRGGIWTSTNAGVTWTQIRSLEELSSIASSSDGADLAVAANFYASGYNQLYGGIFTSTNAGVTWTQTSAPWVNINWSSIASSSDGTRLAAMAYSGGIWTSSNAGLTWSQTSAPTNSWSSIASSSDGIHLAAVVNGGGIYTSPHAGVTWTQTSAPVGSWASIVSSSDGTKLAAVIQGGGIWTARASVTKAALFPFAAVVVDGPLGSNYLIQAASNLAGNWTTLTNVALPWQPYLYIDDRSATNSQQFYRATLAP